MPAYYNEIDPYAAQWLRNLIAAGHIAAGDVDERSIVDVRPDDLRGYAQCHFFAGIGGWSYALRLAGWPDDRHVWTGSCPCQPFSLAGRRRGFADERHLWPEFHRLIAECRPPVALGEQVASADGRLWLAGVRADLEALGYGVGAADLCAAGVGAPHIRQRLWWVADAGRLGGEHDRLDVGSSARDGEGEAREQRIWPDARDGGNAGRMGDTDDAGPQGRDELRHRTGERSPWEASWIGCTDGKQRRTQPGIFPLAHGVPNRVGRLRAYGNAIVPQVFAEFIASYREAVGEDGVVTLRQMIG